MHVTEGANPKGRSVGGRCRHGTAIVSIMTGIPVSKDVADDRRDHASCRVLPIGGLKEKLLAALRGGIKKVLISGRKRQGSGGDSGQRKERDGNHSGIAHGRGYQARLIRQPEPIEWDGSIERP